MDALLRVEKNNKKKKSLAGSTITRTSFGSLLQSIKQTDDRAEEDASNSDSSKIRPGQLQLSQKKPINFKSNINLIDSFSDVKSKTSQAKSKVQSITKNKPIQIDKTFAQDINPKINQRKLMGRNQKSHVNKVLQKLGKSFVTENSSKSSSSSSLEVLKTCFQEKPRDHEKVRKRYGTDRIDIKERNESESSSSFDSDFELDSDNEPEIVQKPLTKGLSMIKNESLRKDKIKTVIHQEEDTDMDENEGEDEDNKKIQPKKMTSIQEKTKDRRPFHTTTNQHQYFSDSKPQNGNSSILKSSTSEEISSLAKKFKQQRQSASQLLKSDMSHYSKEASRKSINSRSKTNAGVTGKRGENPREFTLAIFQYCSHEIGLACYNNTTGEFHLCQLVENLTYFRTLSTIQIFSPLEIIYAQNFENTLLIKKLRQKFRQAIFKPIFRRFFDEEAGQTLYLKTSSHEILSTNSKFLALSCFNALLLHLQNTFQNKFSLESLTVSWHRLDQLLIIQPDAITDLEIFYNYDTNKNKKCLIQNFTCITFGGTRMLRANFLQPPSDSKVIAERQKLVQKMLQNPTLFEFVEKEFYTYKYYEPVTAKFVQSPKQENFKSLKSYLSSIFMLSRQCLSLQNLYQSLEDRNAFQLPIIEKLDSKLQSHKLKILKTVIQQNFDENILKNYQEIKNKKDKIIFLFKVEKIEDDFAIVTRTTYNQTVETIRSYFNEVRTRSNEEVHLMYNENRGYFFRVNDTVDLHHLTQRLQENLVQISHRGRIVTFSTQILSSLNNRVKETQRILIFQSQSLLRKVIDEIQKNIDILFEINQILSTIDMVMSFVRYINRYSLFVKFNKPNFAKGVNKFIVKKLKPVWMLTPENFQNQLQEIDFIQQDGNQNILLLEKSSNSISQSIFMYSIAYIVILGQMGCFVPVQNAEFTLFESMLSKIQVQEKTETGLSRFQLNLVKIQNILDNCFIKNQGRSLVLMDEIVRGTQHEQECALSLAIIQQLQKNNGMSILTTSDRMLIQFLVFDEEFKSIQIFRTKNCEVEHQAIQEITEQSVESMKRLNFSDDFIEGFEEIRIQAQYTKINQRMEIEQQSSLMKASQPRSRQ